MAIIRFISDVISKVNEYDKVYRGIQLIIFKKRAENGNKMP